MGGEHREWEENTVSGRRTQGVGGEHSEWEENKVSGRRTQ